jgi:hypothetical protein
MKEIEACFVAEQSAPGPITYSSASHDPRLPDSLPCLTISHFIEEQLRVRVVRRLGLVLGCKSPHDLHQVYWFLDRVTMEAKMLQLLFCF